MQREFEFPRKPNRPNNWYANDFTQAVWIAVGEGDLDHRTAGLLCFVANLEHKLRYEKFPRFHERQLAERIGLAKSTMRDCRQRAIDAGWLTTRPTPRGTEYEVSIPPAYEESRRHVPVVSSPQRSETGRDLVGNWSASRPESDQNPTILYPSSPIPLPAPSPNQWGEVVKRLREAGVIRATQAVQIAQRNALSPEQVQSWIDFATDEARSGDYGPGVLYDRITNPDARSFPAEHGWPQPNPQGKQHRDRIRQVEQARRDADARQREATEAAAAEQRRRERTTQLELQFGAELDALSLDSQLALIADDFHRRRIGKHLRENSGRAGGMVRLQLLDALAARYAEN